MGGLFIIAGLVASVLLFGDLGNGYVAPALLVAGGMTLLGMIDDLVKIRSAAKGISARHKLARTVDRGRRWPPCCSTSSKPPWPTVCCCGCRWRESRFRWGSGSFRWPSS